MNVMPPETIDPLGPDFEIMCFVKDQRAASGKCTREEAVQKFGKDAVQRLIDNKVLSLTQYGMMDWTYAGTKAMGPNSVRRHIMKQIARETNNQK